MIKFNFINTSLNNLLKFDKTAKKEFQFLYNSFRAKLLLTTYKELFFFITFFLMFYKKKKIKNKFFLRRFFKVLFLKTCYKNKIIKNSFKTKKIQFNNYSYLTFFLNYHQPIQLKTQKYIPGTKTYSSIFQKKAQRTYSFYLTKVFINTFIIARKYSLMDGFKKYIKVLQEQNRLFSHVLAHKKRLLKMGSKRRFKRFNRKRRRRKLYKLTAYRIPRHYQNFRKRRVRDIPAMLYNYFQSDRSQYIVKRNLEYTSAGLYFLFSKQLLKNLKNLKKKIFFEQQKKKNYLTILKFKKNSYKLKPQYSKKKLIKNKIIEPETTEFFNHLNYLIDVNNSNLVELTKKYFKKRLFLNRLQKTMYLKYCYKRQFQKNKKYFFKFFSAKQFKIEKFSLNFLFKKIKKTISLNKINKNLKFFYYLTKSKKIKTKFIKTMYYILLKYVMQKKIQKKLIQPLFFKSFILKSIKLNNNFFKNKTSTTFFFKKINKNVKISSFHFSYCRKMWELVHFFEKNKRVKVNTKRLRFYLKTFKKMSRTKYNKKFFTLKKKFFKKYYSKLSLFYFKKKFFFNKSKTLSLILRFKTKKKRHKQIKIYQNFFKYILTRRFKKNITFLKYKKLKKSQITFNFLKKKIQLNIRNYQYNIIFKKIKNKYKTIYRTFAPKRRPFFINKKLWAILKHAKKQIRKARNRKKRINVKFTLNKRGPLLKIKFLNFPKIKKKKLPKKLRLRLNTPVRASKIRIAKFKKDHPSKINQFFLFNTNLIFHVLTDKPLFRQAYNETKKFGFKKYKRYHSNYIVPPAFQHYVTKFGGVRTINLRHFKAFTAFLNKLKNKNLQKNLSTFLKFAHAKKILKKFSNFATSRIHHLKRNKLECVSYIIPAKHKWRRRPRRKKPLSIVVRPSRRVFYYYKKILNYKSTIQKNQNRYKNFKSYLLKKLFFKKNSFIQKNTSHIQKNQILNHKNKFIFNNYPIAQVEINEKEINQVNFCDSILNYSYAKRLQLFFTFIKKNKTVNYNQWILQKNLRWTRRRAFATWRGAPLGRRKRKKKIIYYTKAFGRKVKRVIAEAEKDYYNHLTTTRENVKRFKFFNMKLHRIFRRFIAFYQYVAYRKKSTKLKDTIKFLARNLQKKNNLKIFYSKFSYKFNRKELFKVRKAYRKNQLLKLKFKLQVFFRHFYNYKKNHQLFLQLKYKKNHKKIFNKILNDFFLLTLKKKNLFLHNLLEKKNGITQNCFINKTMFFATQIKKKNKSLVPFSSLLPYTLKKQKLLSSKIFEQFTKNLNKSKSLVVFNNTKNAFIKKNIFNTIKKLNKKYFFYKPTQLLTQKINLKHNFFLKLKLHQKKQKTGYYYHKLKKVGYASDSIFKFTKKHYLASQYKKLKTLKPFFENNTIINNYTLQYFKLHTQKQHLINTFTILESQLNILLYRMKFVPNLQLLPKIFFYNLVYLNNKIIRNPYHVVNTFELIQIPYIITKKFYFYAFGNSTNILKFSTQKSIFYFLKVLKHIYNPYTAKIWIPSYFTTNISIASGFLHSQPVLEYFLEPLLKFTKLFRNATKKRLQPISKQLQILKVKRAVHKQKKLKRRRKHHRYLAADYCLVKLDFFNFLDFYNNY